LDNYQHGVNKFNEVTKVDRLEIWQQFDLMQMGFCAYCECVLAEKHIEHFKNKDTYKRDTFKWNNLFGSCDDSNRCGHYKDSRKAKPYDIVNILKPDVDDATDYFIFLTNGKVVVKEGLTVNQHRRASETIRVFNLNGDTSLVNRRKTAFKNIKINIDTLYEMVDDFEDPLDWDLLLESEIDDLKSNKVEFQTAMEHAWRCNKYFL
jgi:uncharacterized protein (TIGR02646 family)